MSLATRCPACTTVFRVVQDQLKVSQGWVRCGHCQEVFNALESLFDLSAGTPQAGDGDPADPWFEPTRPAFDDGIAAFAPAAAPERRPQAPAPATPARPPETPAGHDDGRPADVGRSGWQAGSLWLPSQDPEVHEAHPPRRDDFVVSRLPGDGDSLAYAAAIDSGAMSDFLRGSPGSDLLPTPAAAQPTFVRQAERQARWQRPWVRIGLGSSITLLALLLLAQLAIRSRDSLAARWPDSRPALVRACGFLGCEVGSPLALDQIVLETSHLARTGEAGVLTLSADLHNTAAYAVRMPALELTFTSDTGQVLVRKVLYRADLGQPATALEADANWHLETRLAVGNLQVAGYTLEVFYP